MYTNSKLTCGFLFIYYHVNKYFKYDTCVLEFILNNYNFFIVIQIILSSHFCLNTIIQM